MNPGPAPASTTLLPSPSVRRRRAAFATLAAATVLADIAELTVALRVGHMTGIAMLALVLTAVTTLAAAVPASGGSR